MVLAQARPLFSLKERDAAGSVNKPNAMRRADFITQSWLWLGHGAMFRIDLMFDELAAD